MGGLRITKLCTSFTNINRSFVPLEHFTINMHPQRSKGVLLKILIDKNQCMHPITEIKGQFN